MVAQGTTLAGRYRLDTRIGAGGMGEVWRGEDIVLARTVAVKVLLPGRMEDPGFVARFQGEARAMATINHSGVVDVYDYGVSGDTVYLVMKFVDGEPLDRLLARLGRIPPQAAMELIAQAASALQAVHDRGIVHRDVKPGNLLVQRDGTLVLTDFGIARSDVANRLTDAGMVLGTAAYCAPEQAEGAPVTPAVDIYALGVVAYECLVGQRPFDGDSAVTIALKHIREAPPPLPQDIPPPVRTLVEIALSKDPARRYPSARAMSEAARAIANGQAPAPAPVQEQQPSPATGATMAPPPEAYQHQHPQHQYQGNQHDSGPYHTGARMAHENTTISERSGGGSRRAAKAPRRTGLVAGIAAAVVLGAGATAVALTGIDLNLQPTPTVSTDKQGNESPVAEPKTTKPKPTMTKPKPTTTKPLPTVSEEPEPTVTEKETEEPDETTSPTPTTPTKTPTKSPSPSSSPTPTVKKVQVPTVVGRPFLEGQEMVEVAGFQVRVEDRTTTTNGMSCGKISQTLPKGGTLLEVNKPVKLIVVDGVCSDASSNPTQSPTTNKG
ncbi:serine/threonine protein kinase [Nonomuraea solani]|uniref:non-specific serine/threonine protein kinase n=1 Tax=Nonomuraea solani TaxID=1144553 RepID=A0A1H6F454_9ACTN|nr:serine/threonine-protein kinase [Nonomuraea solani]SEH03754.1 serine/threonine protein kinase [Nonomuraea solani]